ncbi:HIT family protein [Sphingomonas edaphi]|jgi:diadenosine tetraphosphate (Ap4A) HIT family hydrolase|uniref:HIT family protein n=1 Tax=Sphingomonas edaphi TaxID=2315689 RepID=A0A418Q147_9SPHN|nr:HIT family protein [Sphingomonas edaphi]RIX31544.1 HIT family protein [Sphingomonas edaphi]
MSNETMAKFGYPNTLVREYEHWVVLLRPQQVTLGSLVLAAKSDATAFGQLPPGAHTELSTITADIEAMLTREISYERINYLMLMMVDPHVHFHVFPRYETRRTFAGEEFVDAGWPGPPDLKSGRELRPAVFEQLRSQLSVNANQG